MPRIPDEIAADFDRFVAGPANLRAALKGLDSGAFNRRPPGDDWSIRDVVMHVTDAELVRAASLRFVMALEEPVVPAWDDTLFKRKLHYLFRDAELALTVLQTVRFSNAELLQQLDAQSWERAGTRADDGSSTTLRELMGRAVGHDANHIAQIEAMREALGVAAETPG
jgi:uncharacterized damage-inducible protein DinB